MAVVGIKVGILSDIDTGDSYRRIEMCKANLMSLFLCRQWPI